MKANTLFGFVPTHLCVLEIEVGKRNVSHDGNSVPLRMITIRHRQFRLVPTALGVSTVPALSLLLLLYRLMCVSVFSRGIHLKTYAAVESYMALRTTVQQLSPHVRQSLSWRNSVMLLLHTYPGSKLTLSAPLSPISRECSATSTLKGG